jgi:hypothetical protein
MKGRESSGMIQGYEVVGEIRDDTRGWDEGVGELRDDSRG